MSDKDDADWALSVPNGVKRCSIQEQQESQCLRIQTALTTIQSITTII